MATALFICDMSKEFRDELGYERDMECCIPQDEDCICGMEIEGVYEGCL